MPRFIGVHEDVVGAFRTSQDPSSFQKLGDQVFALHFKILHTVHTECKAIKKPRCCGSRAGSGKSQKLYTVKIVQPVVLRASKSRCA